MVDQQSKWLENCEFLRVHDGLLYEYLKSHEKSFNNSIRWNEKNSTWIPLFLRDNQNFKPLHSKINPFREAKRFIDQASIKKSHNLICLGLGLGYHLFELLNSPSCPRWIFIIEADLLNFYAFCHLHDIRFLFQTKGLFFISGVHLDLIFNRFLEHSFSIAANGVKIIQYPSCVAEKKEIYQGIIQQINDFVKWANANINTQIRASNLFSKNIFKNLPVMIKSIPVSVFKNQFKDYSCVIVSGGPSLCKNGHLLKYIQDQVLIFCVDTSLRFLVEQGIEPHFIISTDFTQNALDYLQSIELKNSIVLVDPEVNHHITRINQDRLCFCHIQGKGILDWIQTIIGDFGSLEKGISVAHTAFSAAIYCGVKKIIFIGQDLAYTGGRTHVKGSSHGVHIKPDETYLTVQGLFGPVKTSNSLKVFLDHYTQMISESDVLVINATEGGAIIPHTQNKTFREVINLELIHENKDSHLNEKIQFCIKKQKKIPTQKLRQELQKIETKLKNVLHLSHQLYSRLNDLIDCITHEKSLNHIKDLMEDYHELNLAIESQTEVMEFIRDNMAKAYLIKAKKLDKNLNELDFRSEKDDVIKIFKMNQSYFKNLQTAVNVIQNQVNDFLFTESSH